MKKIYDLTVPITKDMTIFPGDPCYQNTSIYSLSKADFFNLSKIELSNHLGTHIDYPSHFFENGKSSSHFMLSQLIGSGLIIEIPENIRVITEEIIKKTSLINNDIVFFKTANSYLPKEGASIASYVYIDEDAANLLVQKKIRIVGIDYLSVDPLHTNTYSAHHIFLKDDVLIIENLFLSTIPAGRYKIFISPLHIPDMDGLPARVFAEELNEE